MLSGDGLASGIANDLLTEVFHGYPVEKIGSLLTSDNETLVQSGAWIASELTKDARPLLRFLLPLFSYPNVSVRYYCVETVLTAATDQDGEPVGRAVTLITDHERPVRRMAFELMARADPGPLAAGLPYAEDQVMAALLEWALSFEHGSRDRNEIASRLQRSDGLERLFAVIAAARVYRRTPEYLQSAASLPDGDAQSFATSELEWLSKLQKQATRRQERAKRRSG